ncbi:hypothetical protein V6N13_098477 [Hibiscus sabdariffa]
MDQSSPVASAFSNWYGEECCEWVGVECDPTRIRIRIHSIFFHYWREQGGELWYPNATLFAQFEELQELELPGNHIGGFLSLHGEVLLSLPAPSIKHDEGYNRNTTVDEGKDVSESHVIAEGLPNINSGVGFSEVNIKERVEANINEVGEGLSPNFERDREAQRVQEEQRDYLDSSDLGSYRSDDDGEVVCKNFKKDYFDPSDKVPSFQLGMIFENSKKFKAALTKYTIAKRFDFKLSMNDRDKTRAVCKGQGCPWTIYASIDSRDEHYKGLIDVVGTVIPECEHRFCARHWFSIWEKLHKNLELHKLFWSCSKATSEADFRKQVTAVGEAKGKALLDMLKKDPTHWSKAFFSTRSLCDSVDNNIAEAFNVRLIGARHMSIISMFEEIRHYVMERNVKNKNSCMKWKNPICPKICAKVKEHKELSAFCHVSWNGADGYEIVSNMETFVVDLKGKNCTCKYYDLTGIPCKHAIYVILFKKDIVEEYINGFYKKDMYEKCYSFVIPSFAGEKFWPATNMGDIEPPLPRKLPGRPKKYRIPEEGKCSGTNLSRRGRKMRCQLCFKLGHNSRTCPTKKQKNQSNVGNEGNTYESIPQPFVHSIIELN